MGGIALPGEYIHPGIQPPQKGLLVLLFLLILGAEMLNFLPQTHFFFSSFCLVPSGRSR